MTPVEASCATKRESRFLRWSAVATQIACTVLSLGFVGTFIWIAANRAPYPFDLEWMEGGMVDHVARILAGKPLYAPPSVEFVPFIYNPLYYWLAVPPALVFGVSHLALRFVSILATLSCFGFVFALVWKETRAFVPSLTSVGMFAGSYALSDGWFDLARVDSTGLAFCMGAWYVARFGRGRSGSIFAAVLLALAFFTKQTTLAMFPALVLATGLMHGFRRTLWFLPVLAAAAGVMAALEISSDGWYSFATFGVPSGFSLVPDMAVDFWKREIFSEYSMALVLGLAFALMTRHGIEWTAALKTHVPFIVSMVGMAYVVRMHQGSYLNDKMPAHAGLSVAAGLGLARLLQVAPPARRDRMWLFGGLVALGQLLFLVYLPDRWVPTRADYAEGEAFMAAMKRYPGDVLLTHHGALTRRLGKGSFAHGMAVIDLLRSTHEYRGAHQMLRGSIQSAFESHRFSAVFADNDLLLPEVRDRYYVAASQEYAYNPTLFLTRAGAPLRPRFVYTPKP